MPVVIVVGVQWGDEGKGKVVDYLTEKAKLVVRFQGGNNAGHTVIVEGKKTALRSIPSGILRPDCRCLLAAGVVLDPEAILSEIADLEVSGVDVSPARLGIAPEISLILPYSRAVDRERERVLADNKIGTTGKGIGPTYEDTVSRSAIKVGDLFSDAVLKTKLEFNVRSKNNYLRSVLGAEEQFDLEEMFQQCKRYADRLKPYVCNVSLEVNRAIEAKELVVFEGAQGTLLDVTHGTYPFVTSSNTIAGYACVSAGFGPRLVDTVLGISKAYCTRVGSGPFPTEDRGTVGETLRSVGKEFGVVTGRPRRCGWFDAVVARRAARLNGIDTLIVTKLDVLSGFETVKLGVAYELDGKQIEDLPTQPSDIERVKVIYETLPGWNADLTAVQSFEQLPLQAKNLLKRIEEVVACRVGGFSVGPDRAQTVLMCEQLRDYSGL